MKSYQKPSVEFIKFDVQDVLALASIENAFNVGWIDLFDSSNWGGLD